MIRKIASSSITKQGMNAIKKTLVPMSEYKRPLLQLDKTA